jgi:hypothetical protein
MAGDATVPSDSAASPDAATVADAFVGDAGARPVIMVVGTLESSGMAATSFQALLATRGDVRTFSGTTIDAHSFDGVALVVFGDLPAPLSTSERASLAGWIVAGTGSALVLGGYEANGQAEAESVVRQFSMDVDLSSPVIIDTGVFLTGAVGQGSLAANAAPGINGGFRLSSIRGPLATPEIQTSAGDPYAARYDSGAGCRAYVFVDEYATLDAGWGTDVATFWSDVLDYLFGR